MSEPLVSVLMPVYNGGRFVVEAVRSIRGQTLAEHEFVIVDDGSTDGTGEVLAAEAREDSRIRVVRQERGGISRALNHGLSVCRGRYVARMDADDVSRPDRLRAQVEYLERSPEAAMVGCWVATIDEEGRSMGRVGKFPVGWGAIQRLLLRHNCFAHAAVMVRAEVVRSLGGYRECMCHAEDYDLWLRVTERHAAANLPLVLLDYRYRRGSMSIIEPEVENLAFVAAGRAARMRREGLGDPLDGAERITRPLLAKLGMNDADIELELATIALTNTFRSLRFGRADMAASWLTRLEAMSVSGAVRRRLASRVQKARALVWWREGRYWQSAACWCGAGLRAPLSWASKVMWRDPGASAA